MKIHKIFTIFRTKMTMTIARKIKIGNLIFFLFSWFRIFHINLTTFEKKKCHFLLWCCSQHWRSGVYIYIFSSMPSIPTCSDYGPQILKNNLPEPGSFLVGGANPPTKTFFLLFQFFLFKNVKKKNIFEQYFFFSKKK